MRLSWIRGFQRLEFRVVFVEQIDERTCVDAEGKPAAVERSVNLDYFRSVVEWAGLAGSAALVTSDGRSVEGPGVGELRDVAADAAVLVNVSGHLTVPELFGAFRKTAYIDIDPGYTQIWHADGTARLRPHGFYFTIGENIGTGECPIPTGGIHWRPVRQPVVLGDWPVGVMAEQPVRFTTVASWRGPFGRVGLGDKTYGLKLHEFRKCMDLPRRVSGATFELALDIHPAEGNDLALLRENGWRLVEPRGVAGTPGDFAAYVRGSSAEFSVAQGVYVETSSGWFSDRTTRYLAAGKPALVQETGFSRHVRSGEGLVSFRTVEEAAEGAGRIAADYAAHCAAARGVAEKYFSSDRVLGRVMEEVMRGE